MKENWE